MELEPVPHQVEHEAKNWSRNYFTSKGLMIAGRQIVVSFVDPQPTYCYALLFSWPQRLSANTNYPKVQGWVLPLLWSFHIRTPAKDLVQLHSTYSSYHQGGWEMC